MKDQIKNCPHLKDKIQKQLDQQKKMPAPKPAPVRAQAKLAEQAKKKPEPKEKKEAKKDVKQEDFLGIYYAQMNILIKASEETKQKMEKLHQENRTINTNMVKLLRRVEALENKVESSSASIPEF